MPHSRSRNMEKTQLQELKVRCLAAMSFYALYRPINASAALGSNWLILTSFLAEEIQFRTKQKHLTRSSFCWYGQCNNNPLKLCFSNYEVGPPEEMGTSSLVRWMLSSDRTIFSVCKSSFPINAVYLSFPWHCCVSVLLSIDLNTRGPRGTVTSLFASQGSLDFHFLLRAGWGFLSLLLLSHLPPRSLVQHTGA